jgi:FKBP-type peptidyl-prolyl cis-trans isomerase
LIDKHASGVLIFFTFSQIKKMKKISLAILATVTGLGASAQTKLVNVKKSVPVKKTGTVSKLVPKPPVFKNNLDSACYALGLNVASSFQSGGLTTLNYEMFNKGLRDAFSKANPQLSQQQAQEQITKLFESFSKQREAVEMKNNQPAINAGKEFLAQNKTKPGIITTASGLQYQVLTPGTGAKPKATDEVTVNYKGTLLNGEEFDSSYKRGEPTTFPLNQVITGWTEGVQLMQEGAKYRFFVPYQLAYGSRATPDGSIPAFSTLIFEIELIKVGQ